MLIQEVAQYGSNGRLLKGFRVNFTREELLTVFPYLIMKHNRTMWITKYEEIEFFRKRGIPVNSRGVWCLEFYESED